MITAFLMWALRIATKGGELDMIDVYVALIVKHRRTIDQVPAQDREAVLADLDALGLDGSGNPVA